jgi:hypothetical protein
LRQPPTLVITAAQNPTRCSWCDWLTAGADTVVSTILSFVLAMAIHPDIQEKAQSELDNVIGPRLPYFTDDEQLPFIVSCFWWIETFH